MYIQFIENHLTYKKGAVLKVDAATFSRLNAKSLVREITEAEYIKIQIEARPIEIQSIKKIESEKGECKGCKEKKTAKASKNEEPPNE